MRATRNNARSNARKEGASQSRRSFSSRYNGWLRHHRLSAADSVHRVVETPFSSLLTALVIGIALALPVALNVGLEHAKLLSASWESPAQISLFLRAQAELEATTSLQEKLTARVDVAAAELITPEQGLVEFQSRSGLADILASLERNPLPAVIVVTPAQRLSAEQVMQLSDTLAAEDLVEQGVLDLEWLRRLNSVMALSQRTVMVIAALLVLGVVLILGNTIRLAIENRRDEIVIIKLVGGSNAFVRRPFLYTGLWYGFAGGLLSAMLVTAALWYLRQPVADLAQLYHSSFQLRGLGLMGFLNMLMLGGLLGLLGAWLAVSRHLSKIEPR